MKPDLFLPRPECPACGAAGAPAFSRAYAEPVMRAALTAFYATVGGLDYALLEDATYHVASCPRCRTWFQSSIPSDALLGKLYEEWIDPEKARLRFHHHQPPEHFLGLAQEVRTTLSLAGTSAPPAALDYGCGWGEWSRMTQAFGQVAWGTELSPTRREHALRQGVRVVTDAELPAGHFGLINIDQVLEHLPAPRACLGLLATKLHPHGVLRVAVPHAGRVSGALRHFDRELARPRLGGLNAIAPLEHLNAFTTTGLLQLAAASGLERIKPAWGTLLGSIVFPRRAAARLKALLRPFYLRSGVTTQLYFRRAAAPR